MAMKKIWVKQRHWISDSEKEKILKIFKQKHYGTVLEERLPIRSSQTTVMLAAKRILSNTHICTAVV